VVASPSIGNNTHKTDGKKKVVHTASPGSNVCFGFFRMIGERTLRVP
jgi:hypothetical protein